MKLLLPILALVALVALAGPSLAQCSSGACSATSLNSASWQNPTQPSFYWAGYCDKHPTIENCIVERGTGRLLMKWSDGYYREKGVIAADPNCKCLVVEAIAKTKPLNIDCGCGQCPPGGVCTCSNCPNPEVAKEVDLDAMKREGWKLYVDKDGNLKAKKPNAVAVK